MDISLFHLIYTKIHYYLGKVEPNIPAECKTAERGLAPHVLVFMLLHQRYAEGAKDKQFSKKMSMQSLASIHF